MEAAKPGRPAGRPDTVNRRRLLQLAGSLGVGMTVGACSTTPVNPSSQATATSAPPNPKAISPGSTEASTLREPGPSVVPTAAAASAELCRAAWGARPALPGGRPHTITQMTIHHTAVVLGDNSNAPSRLRQHQQFHQNDRGWIDIAYHVGVDRNGNIYELRTPEIAGDTATEYDPAGHFLVVCEGDFDQEPISEAQLNSAALAFAWAAQNFHIGSDTLAGHRDFAATSCPGGSLYARVSSGDLKQRIDDVLNAGTVNLQKFCGPEAAARVADIEAGR